MNKKKVVFLVFVTRYSMILHKKGKLREIELEEHLG